MQSEKPATEIVNKADVLSRLDGDEELFREIIGIFLTDSQSLVEQVSAAITRQDSEGVERTAHKLKGAVSTFTRGEALSAAQQLETMGRDHDLTHAVESFAQLKKQVGAGLEERLMKMPDPARRERLPQVRKPRNCSAGRTSTTSWPGARRRNCAITSAA